MWIGPDIDDVTADCPQCGEAFIASDLISLGPNQDSMCEECLDYLTREGN